MLSQDLTRLAAVFAPYEAAGCELTPAGIAHIQTLLLDAAAQARQLELQVVPASARATAAELADGERIVALDAPRAASAPPWGWGERR